MLRNVSLHKLSLITLICILACGCGTNAPKEKDRYYNNTLKFSIKIPSDFQKQPAPKPDSVFFYNPKTSEQVLIAALKTNNSLPNNRNEVIAMVERNGMNFVSEGRETVDGVEALWYIGTQRDETILAYLIPKNKRLYSPIMGTKTSNFTPDYEEKMRTILESLRYEK